MALAYAALKDKLKEAEALYRAFKAGYRDRSMLESLGIKLYSMLRLSESQDVLTEAVNMGSTNGTVQKALQILNGMSEEDKLETALQKANEYMSKENYKEAEPIYKYLLEKKYKTGIILLNTGVFYFKTNNMDLAIDYFGKSLNETKTPEGYLYLGYSYFNKGKKAEAINTLRQGIKQYPDDARLKELEGKILKN